MNNLPSVIDQYLELEDLKKILKIKKTKIYNLIKSRELAAPLKIGSRSLWLPSDIQAYQSHILSARDKHNI